MEIIALSKTIENTQGRTITRIIVYKLEIKPGIDIWSCTGKVTKRTGT